VRRENNFMLGEEEGHRSREKRTRDRTVGKEERETVLKNEWE
jgi:hypothetical protein